TVAGNTFDGSDVGVSLGVNHFIGDGSITGNTFIGNRAAGILVDADRSPSTSTIDIRGNTFRSNGRQSGGKVDLAGRAVNDGVHINAPAGSAITLTGNHTFDNADYGIEAQPGTVIDGGGNTSSGDPNGCLGVACP